MLLVMSPGATRVFAPGRVNLIGDHTDYTGGLVLPMTIHLGTTVEGERGGDVVRLVSANLPGEAVVPLSVTADDARSLSPRWARYVAGVVSVLRPSEGLTGRVSTTLPIGAGLSSSAALEVAVAKAVGFDRSLLRLARACQEAEQLASGVPCGVMDQLASAVGTPGQALLIDCTSLTLTRVPMPSPTEVEVVVVHSGEQRALAGSAYAQRRAQCEAAAVVIGPLRDATLDDIARIDDDVLRARARHVVTENARVLAFVEALRSGDFAGCGRLLVESHRSLAGDFAVSTPALDALVDRLLHTPGVFGARLTGAGFGGCVVALARPGAIRQGWRVSGLPD